MFTKLFKEFLLADVIYQYLLMICLGCIFRLFTWIRESGSKQGPMPTSQWLGKALAPFILHGRPLLILPPSFTLIQVAMLLHIHWLGYLVAKSSAILITLQSVLIWLNVLSTAVLCTITALISQEGMYSTEWLAWTLFIGPPMYVIQKHDALLYLRNQSPKTW